MTISTIVPAITGIFSGRDDPAASESFPPKDLGTSKIWLNRLEDVIKRLARKTVKILHAITGSVVCVILSFLGKTVDL